MTLFSLTSDKKRLAAAGQESRLPSISPGAANPFTGCFDEAVWRDKRYLVWGCGTGIVVYCDNSYSYEDVSRRPFAKRLEIRAVSMSSQMGLIASCDSEQLRIHQSTGEDDTEWPVVLHELQPTLNCIAWSHQGTLITAGDGITIWSVAVSEENGTIELNTVWKTTCLGTPIAAIIATEYSTMFATLGAKSRLVKVWHGNTDRVDYQYSYLSHPRSVINAIWRDRNIPSLVTLCTDGFSRVWTAQAPDAFYITNVVDVSGTGVWPMVPPNAGRRIVSWSDCSEGQSLALDNDHSSDSSSHRDMLVDAILLEYTDASELIAWAMLYDDDGSASLQSAPLMIGKIQLEGQLKSLDSCVIQSANNHSDIGLSLMTPAGDIYHISFGKLNCPEPSLVSVASGNRRTVVEIAIQPPYIATRTQDDSITCFLVKPGQTMLEPVWQASNVSHFSWVQGSDVLLSVEKDAVLAYALDSGHITRTHVTLPKLLSSITLVKSVLLSKNVSNTSTMTAETWALALTGRFMSACVILNRDGIAIATQATFEFPDALAVAVSRDQLNIKCTAQAYCVVACKNGSILVSLIDEQGQQTSLGQFNVTLLSKAQNVHISINHDGTVALAYIIDGQATVEIWSLNKLSKQWVQGYCYTIRKESPLLNLMWQQQEATSTDLLILSTCSGLNLVARVRSIDSAYAHEWRLIGSIPMAQQCSAQFYGADMVLVKAESCRIITVMNIWSEIHWEFAYSSQQRSLAQILTILKAEMPLYHPELLGFMARQADFERTRIALHILEEMVHNGDKYDEYLASNNKILQCLRPVYNLSDTLPIAKSAAEYLANDLGQFELPGITVQERQDLCTLIKVMAEIIDWLRSLDAIGARFALAVRLATIGNNNNNGKSSSKPLKLGYRELSWAYYSLGQDSLFSFCQSHCSLTMDWPTVAALGIPMWLKDTNTLKGLLLKMARDRFTVSKDPMSASLFFLALRKKTLLLGLWRTASFHPEQSKMLKFLSQDFDDSRKQSAALKNAFALLGKQRYELAASFFLLANRLKDAVNVCLKHLKDIQLAICICRVYEGDDSPSLRDLYTTLTNLSSIELQQILPQENIVWLKSVIAFAADDRIQAMNILVVSSYL
ncbi:RAVE protein 1 C terminal-domain-containing protein [Syncephalis fuscata]|nr:RAVE protein 1 C terminal-domain-containing protein [Syncephalis fuscata]